MATLLEIYNIRYGNSDLKKRVISAVAKAAADVRSEANPSSNMLYDAASGQKVVSVTNRHVFWVGKGVTISDDSNSEEAVIASISVGSGDTGNLTMQSNLTNSYTATGSGKVSFTNNNERLAWAAASLENTPIAGEKFMWPVSQNATINVDPDNATDNDIQYVVNSNVNNFAKTY